jgi:hypothetical protein
MDMAEDYRVTDAEHVDAKGRPAVKLMSERELLEEIVTTLRVGVDAMDGMVANGVFANPMIKQMLGL